MKLLLLSFRQAIIAALCICLGIVNAFAQCTAPTNFNAQPNTGVNNSVVLSWNAVDGALGYQIRVTNMVTNVTGAPILVTAEPATQQSFILDGLAPDQDYLVRIRTVCCQPTPTTTECFSPYARTLAAASATLSGVINLERIIGSGSTTVQERGPLYLCNLDLVKFVTISVKNLTTLVTNNITIPPDSCICVGDADIYKITVTSGNNFKVNAPRTRLDCSSGSSKTDATVETLFDDVLFYPNPTTGNLTVEYLALPNESAKIVFYNNTGQQVANYLLPAGNNWQSVTYNLSHLPTGVYFCKMQSKQGVKVQKIVLSNE